MITPVPRAAQHLQTFARQRMDQTLASRAFTAGIWRTNAAWASVGRPMFRLRRQDRLTFQVL